MVSRDSEPFTFRFGLLCVLERWYTLTCASVVDTEGCLWTLLLTVQHRGVSHFIALCPLALCKYCIFFFSFFSEACGNSAVSSTTGTIFSTAFADFIFLCRILVIRMTSHFLIILLFANRRSMIGDYDSLRAHMMISTLFLQRNIFQ